MSTLKLSMIIISYIAAFNSSAFAQSLLNKSTNYKGYAKRERLSLISTQAITPSQIHEIYGYRFDSGISFQNNKVKNNDTKVSSNTNTPTFAVRGFMGGDILVLGLGASTTRSKGTLSDDVTKESYTANKLVPQLAITAGNHLTFGVSSEFVRMLTVESNQNINFNYARQTFGFSYHTSKMELGVEYTTKANDTTTIKNAETATSLRLTAISAEGERDLYLPSHVTGFARANLTNSFSVLGSVTLSEYNNNEKGASKLFTNSKYRDRIAGILQGTYWLASKSRINTSLLYQGAAVAPSGSLTTGLGERIANTYGIAFDFVAQVTRKTAIGLNLNYQQGRRNETTNNITSDTTEKKMGLGASLTHNI